jgi:hypothetical protein
MLKGSHHRPESIRKMQEATKGARNPMFGKHHREETKRRIGKANEESLKGNTNKLHSHLSIESCRRISKSKKGCVPWNKGRRDIHLEEPCLIEEPGDLSELWSR